MKTVSLAILFVLGLLLSPFAAYASLTSSVPSGSAVYVEPFEGDAFHLLGRLESEVIRAGYSVVDSPERASFTIKWSYSHGAVTYATVRIVNSDGVVVHLGESRNPGFGTIINKNGATWGRVRKALMAD